MCSRTSKEAKEIRFDSTVMLMFLGMVWTVILE